MEIDFVKFLKGATRRIEDREYEGEAARVVTISRTYDTTVEDLWNALTDIGRIPRWFLPISGDLHVGGRYQLEGNAGGQVLTCDAPTHFHITWEFGGGVSWVDVQLTADGDGARLRLEHIAHPDDHWKQYGPGAVGIGWELGLLGLATHLQTGEANVPEKGMAWMMSDEGKSAMRQSGEAWIVADIESGTPEDEAREKGANTIAAYTGG